MEEAKDIAIPLFIEAGHTVYEAEGGQRGRTVVQNDTLVFDSTTATSRPSDLIEKAGGRSTSRCTCESGSSAARYAASSGLAADRRCERRLLLRRRSAKPSFVRCLKTALRRMLLNVIDTTTRIHD